jgi:hypothetical protein
MVTDAIAIRVDKVHLLRILTDEGIEYMYRYEDSTTVNALSLYLIEQYELSSLIF